MNFNHLEKKNEHHILKASYFIHDHILVIGEAEQVLKETNCFYNTMRHRYAKEILGKAQLKSRTSYPYVEVAVLDGTEEDARRLLREWFENRGNLILEMKKLDTNGSRT